MLVAVSTFYSFGLFFHDVLVNGSLSGAYAANKSNFIFPLLGLFYALLWKCGVKVDLARLSAYSTTASLALAAMAIMTVLVMNSDFEKPKQILLEMGVLVNGRFTLYARNALMFGTLYLGVTFVGLIGYEKKAPARKAMILFSLLVAPVVLYLIVQARGAMIAYMMLLGLSLAFVKIPKRTIIGVTAAILLVLISLLRFYDDVFISGRGVVLDSTSSHLELMARLLDADTSIRVRMEMYLGGLEAFMSNPLFGFGYQMRFEAVFGTQPPGNIGEHGHLHNVFINHLVAAGIPGVLLLMMIWLLPLWSLVKTRTASGDVWFFAGVYAVLFFGVGMTTEVTGHYVHTLFFGSLLGLIHTTIAGHRLAV